MDAEVIKLLDRFNEVVNDAQKFTFFPRAIEFQKEAVGKLDKLQEEIIILKKGVVQKADNNSANFLLGLSNAVSALSEELKMFVALKEDEPSKAWDALIFAQQSVSTAIKVHEKFAYLRGYAQKLHAIEQLFFPPQTFCSPGFVVTKSRCSICNLDYGECDHIKGRAYMGELCVCIIDKCEFLELSMVKDPASKHARATSFSCDEGQRDIMTWRILKSTGASQSKTTQS